jgi:hypothetical protein
MLSRIAAKAVGYQPTRCRDYLPSLGIELVDVCRHKNRPSTEDFEISNDY